MDNDNRANVIAYSIDKGPILGDLSSVAQNTKCLSYIKIDCFNIEISNRYYVSIFCSKPRCYFNIT